MHYSLWTPPLHSLAPNSSLLIPQLWGQPSPWLVVQTICIGHSIEEGEERGSEGGVEYFVVSPTDFPTGFNIDVLRFGRGERENLYVGE